MKTPMPTDIFSPGQVLNNTYEIEGVLGRGGTGEVYLARNQINERVVAIKALNARFARNEDYVELMKREDQIRAIVHDAVVRYTECSRTDAGHVFLVMEYVEGPSLNDVMMERRLDDRELLIIASRVLEGLVPTHDHGIVHRDLSPDNIILRGGQAERATIIDFGIAKDTSAGARTIVGNEFAGKYEYAAPEQLDGRSDARVDLYALGASLLAAHRREVPDPGSTPAEIVRRKAQPLDTRGVSEPLKSLIDWLSAPDPDDRPRDAAEALDRVGGLLKPRGRQASRRAADRASDGGPRPPLVPVLGVALATVLGIGLWASGLLDPLFPEPLPVASPYRISASLADDGTASLTGNAPSPEIAQDLAARFAESLGVAPDTTQITLAQGMPSESWPASVAGLFEISAGLERFELAVADGSARLTGLAPDRDSRAALGQRIEDHARQSGLSVSYELQAGPEELAASTLASALAGLATCGPLHLDEGVEVYGPEDTVTVTGDLAAPRDAEAIRRALSPALGDRDLRLQTTALNQDLCAIRAVLPPVPPQALSISLLDGATGEPTLTGVFRTGENPVADVLMPSNVETGSLWVMVVDNTGKVFHILPNINQPDHEISDLGIVENGVRRVRVLWSIEEFRAVQTRLAMQVTDGDFGKSEIIAILSREPLFGIRRPRDESVASVAEALEDALQGREGEILGVASRIIDARP